jgi:biotin transport system substrate-specific component
MQNALPASIGVSSGTTPQEELLHTAPHATLAVTAGQAAKVVAATVFVALCAHISVPLPFTLVPITMQTFAVILVGMLLGPVGGFAALSLYLAEGAAGMPVFSPHGLGGLAQLFGPTGGYLFSYPVAAALAGWVTGRSNQLRFDAVKAGVAGAVATTVILILGAAWLVVLLHLGPRAAFHLGIEPFLIGEVVKITGSAGMFTMLRRWQRS